MDIKAFYQQIDNNLRKGGYSLFDKFKLDNSDLVSAVKNSDQAAVAEALNAWVNPNKPDGLERLALPLAVDNNHEVIVGMLLSRNANPDVRSKDGETALYKAVSWENENIVRLLLDKGATAIFPNLDGRTPIQEAKEKGYRNILALLSNDKTELKRMQVEKDQATHLAMKQRAQKAKSAKLNASVIPTKVAEESPTESYYSDQEVAIVEKYGKTTPSIKALLNAIKNKDSQAVKYFVGHVEDLNKWHEGESPLRLSIEGGKEKLAIFLVDNGANLFQKDAAGNYPHLNNAVQHQFYDLLKIAFSKEESVAIKLNDVSQSFSAQFLAYMDPKMMNILLQNGADPFFGGKDGVSPILKAIQKGSIAILPVLALHKTPFDKKIDKKSLIEWAIESKRLDWINGLITENALLTANENDINDIKRAANDSNDPKIKGIISEL